MRFFSRYLKERAYVKCSVSYGHICFHYRVGNLIMTYVARLYLGKVWGDGSDERMQRKSWTCATGLSKGGPRSRALSNNQYILPEYLAHERLVIVLAGHAEVISSQCHIVGGAGGGC